MTAISATSGSTYQSPLQRLQDELQSEINSGAISSSDQDALSSALTDIDASMQASRAGDTRPSPDEMKSKLDDLINQEVSSGKLTSDQATELQGVFKAAFTQGPGGAHGHRGGAGGPPPSDDSTSTDDASTTTDSVSDILQQFLQSLQDSLSESSSSYNSAGSASTSANGSSFSALLIDYQS